MNRSLMTTVAVVMSVSTPAAHAADGAPGDWNWSGYYIGADLGGAGSKTDLTNTVSDPALNWTDFRVGDRLGYTQSGLVGGAMSG